MFSVTVLPADLSSSLSVGGFTSSISLLNLSAVVSGELIPSRFSLLLKPLVALFPVQITFAFSNIHSAKSRLRK